jgi:hypothetical protein
MGRCFFSSSSRGLPRHSHPNPPPSSRVNLGSTWGQLGVNLGSAWGQLGVNLGSTWGQLEVNFGSGGYCSPHHRVPCNSNDVNGPISVYRLGEMPTQSCGQSVSAARVNAGARLNAHTELRAKRQRSAREAIYYRNRPIRSAMDDVASNIRLAVP